jgi:putative restriction endonuclease
MDLASHDAQLRQAAFSHVDRLATIRGGVIDSADLAGGFEFGGERIPLINPQRGIFKPRQMEHLLSIKTVFPRRGARVWYDDQRDAHRQIYAGDDVVDYQFMGTDPNSADNRWLRDAMLFPRHFARSVSAYHPDIYCGVASGAPTGPACVWSARGGLGSSSAT